MKLKGRPVTWWRRDEVNFLNNVAPPIGTKIVVEPIEVTRLVRNAELFSFSCRTGKVRVSRKCTSSKMYFVENLFCHNFTSERVRRKYKRKTQKKHVMQKQKTTRSMFEIEGIFKN